MIDFAEEERERIQDEYKEELGEVNLHREFTYSKHNQSIERFKEIIERLIELEKYRKIKISQQEHISDFSSMIKINVLEETLNYLDKYINNELQEEYKRELQITEWLSDDN